MKQTDKLYFKYIFKILSLMPGVDKSLFTKIKEQEEKMDESDDEGEYEEEA